MRLVYAGLIPRRLGPVDKHGLGIQVVKYPEPINPIVAPIGLNDKLII
jgi:hypothetical protein